MAYVATLIADPERARLDKRLLAAAADALAHAGASLWLDEGVAADIPFTRADADLKTVAARVRAALMGAAVDVIVQPVADRRKRLFLADMDSTMIGQECIDELADFVGLRGKVSAITERAMRGEIAFEPALRERVGLLRGLPSSIVAKIIAERITLTPGGRALVTTMRAGGAYCCLVSGGFTLFTAPIGAMIGFDEDRSNILEVEGGMLAGLVREPILGKEAKRATLIELRDRMSLAPALTLAVGDGANDLAMLQEAGLGVAFRAKPAVAEAVQARIEHGDLSALLYAQGYRREEFAEA
jgi:phosphoserine phosphatase